MLVENLKRLLKFKIIKVLLEYSYFAVCREMKHREEPAIKAKKYAPSKIQLLF